VETCGRRCGTVSSDRSWQTRREPAIMGRTSGQTHLGREHKVIDLISDTATRPSPEMRRAMAEAEVGDEQLREDPSVNRLQTMVAELTGKEAALFLPTGTMCNAIGIKVHKIGRA